MTRLFNPIESMTDIEMLTRRIGFLPMFRSCIPGFSVYENTMHFWSEDGDGPWEWKGPIIRDGQLAYGKFFSRKAGFVSRECLPDFLNYRQSRRLAPNEDAAAMDDIVLQTIAAEGRATIASLREILGLSNKRRRGDCLVDDVKIEGCINLDTNLTRLMMEGRIVIADFVYNTDRHGNAYGWGIAKYTTPELLYGVDIAADGPPEESLTRIIEHLQSELPQADPAKVKKIILA